MPLKQDKPPSFSSSTILGMAVTLGALGCGDAHVHFSSCTSFQDDGAQQRHAGRTVRDCNGTVIVVVHDAPPEGFSSFTITIERLELMSAGRAYLFFEGGRRENLLDYRQAGFLLGRRDDVPEVEFDLIRLRLSEVEVSPNPGGQRPRLKDDGVVEAPLDPPLVVAAPFPQRLRIDIDVLETLANGEQALEAKVVAPLAPVVRGYGTGDPAPAVLLAPMEGTILTVDRRERRFRFRSDHGIGEYWASFDLDGPSGGGPASQPAVSPGGRVILEALLGEDGLLDVASLRPHPDSRKEPGV
jgi:hypothetical protein